MERGKSRASQPRIPTQTKSREVRVCGVWRREARAETVAGPSPRHDRPVTQPVLPSDLESEKKKKTHAPSRTAKVLAFCALLILEPS